jgi:hypothetical protein
MDDSQTYQLRLLQQIESDTGRALPPAVRQAFIDLPRHYFIPAYRHPLTHQWCEVRAQTFLSICLICMMTWP